MPAHCGRQVTEKISKRIERKKNSRNLGKTDQQ